MTYWRLCIVVVCSIKGYPENQIKTKEDILNRNLIQRHIKNAIKYLKDRFPYKKENKKSEGSSEKREQVWFGLFWKSCKNSSITSKSAGVYKSFYLIDIPKNI